MSGVIKPRLEILPPVQAALWPLLRPAAALGFVLYGGTAVALRLGHRQSVDFDFFSEKPLARDAIVAAFPFIVRATVLQDAANTFTVNVPATDTSGQFVKVSFFGQIGFGRVGEPDVTEDGVLQIAALDDLLATKLKVILQRAEAKDYRDIAAMVGAGVSIARGLGAAQQLYGGGFQPSESLKALAYFEDGDLPKLTREEKKLLIAAARVTTDLPAVKIRAKFLTA